MKNEEERIVLKPRDLKIELAKVIITGMVVVLHVIGVSEVSTVNQCLYLLGTFGIPLL